MVDGRQRPSSLRNKRRGPNGWENFSGDLWDQDERTYGVILEQEERQGSKTRWEGEQNFG